MVSQIHLVIRNHAISCCCETSPLIARGPVPKFSISLWCRSPRRCPAVEPVTKMANPPLLPPLLSPYHHKRVIDCLRIFKYLRFKID